MMQSDIPPVLEVYRFFIIKILQMRKIIYKPIDRFGQWVYTDLNQIGQEVINTESFSNLSIEKQNSIFDAALSVFGRNGYKKASVNDIASAAGISKASLFYYFGNKKAMYVHLAELCIKSIVEEVSLNLNKDVTSFFDRIKLATQIKMAVLKKHPSMLMFIKSVYYETDVEVEDTIAKLRSMSGSITDNLVFDWIDTTKFKEDVDARIIFKFLMWASEGFAAGLTSDNYNSEIDTYVNEFYILLEMMKKNLYKPEYL